VLYNIAKAYLAAKDISGALDFFERYNETEPPDRAKVVKVVRSLRRRLAIGSSASARSRRPPRTKPKGEAPRKPTLVATPAPEKTPVAASPPGTEGEPVPGPQAGQAPPPAQYAELTTQLAALSAQMSSLTGAVERIREQTEPPAPPAPEPDAVEPALPDLQDKSGDAYEQVVVSAARRASSRLDAPSATTIITEEDIRLSGARTLPDLLRRVPGMELLTLTVADSSLAVRGFNQRLSNKLLVLLNGRSVYLDFLGLTWWSMLPIQMEDIERVEVIRGPGSTLYGANAFGGVVNIITRPPGQKRSTFTATAGSGNTLRASHVFGGRSGDVGYRASVGYEQANRFSREYDPARADFVQTTPQAELGLEVSRFDTEFRWVPDRDTSVGISGGLARGGMNFYALGILKSFWAQGTNAYGMLDAKMGPLEARAFINHLDVDSVPDHQPRGGQRLETSTVADVVDVEAVFNERFVLGLPQDLHVGAGYRLKYIEWDWLTGSETEHHFKGFLEDRVSLTDSLAATVGLRVDQHPLVGLTTSPRGALVYRPGEHSAIRLTAGTAFRTPSFLENHLDLAVPSPITAVSIRSKGDVNLAPEEISQVDLGFITGDGDFLEFEVVGYLQEVRSLVQLGALRSPGSAGFPAVEARRPAADSGTFIAGESGFVNNDEVFRGGGLEFAARFIPSDGIDLTASYTIEAMYDAGDDRSLGNPLHKANLGVHIRTALGLDTGFDAHYVSGVDITERAFDPETRALTVIGCPVDPYLLVNGRIGYRALNDRLEIAFSAINLAGPFMAEPTYREHCFGNALTTRAYTTLTYRFGQ
jgi:iron complex outermembrane receptor protein